MNSLNDYKGQVYNIGSPTPSPLSISPLEKLPFSNSVEADFEFSSEQVGSKSKVNQKKSRGSNIPKAAGSTRSSAKRKLETEDNSDFSGSPPKKVKMMSEEMFQEYIRKVDEKAAATKQETEEMITSAFQKSKLGLTT